MVFPKHIVGHDLKDFRQDLFRDLRVELGHLKTCQNAAIAVGITGSGVVLGLIRGSPPESLSVFVILPLLVLFPFWLVFFDKAKTVARIVGFIRLQEYLLFAQSNFGGIGWESALSQYWEKKPLCEENRYHEKGIQELSKQLIGRRARIQQGVKRICYKIRVVVKSTYLTTVFGIFFIFSLMLVCAGLYFSGFPTLIIGILSILTLANFILNYVFYGDSLDYPQYSYFLYFDGGLCFCLMVLPIIYSTFPYQFDWAFSLSSVSWLVDQIGTMLPRFFLDSLPSLIPTGLPRGLSFDSVKIFVMAGSLVGFVYFTTLTYWMLTNLLYGRYTTSSFVRRWEVVLNLKLNPATGTARFQDWKDKGTKNDKIIFEKLFDLIIRILEPKSEG